MNFVYRHPSIESLAQITLGFACGEIDQEDKIAGRVDLMKQLVEQLSYQSSGDPQDATMDPSTQTMEGGAAIVTGTTGALGSGVLAKLVDIGKISHVYAFNRRSTDGRTLEQRQRQALTRRNLDPNIASSPKVSLCEVDFDALDFGLTDTLYKELKRTVTHIFVIGKPHNCSLKYGCVLMPVNAIAWPVNFNLTLQSFVDSVTSIRNFTNFTLSSNRSRPPRVIFASSVGIFKQLPQSAAQYVAEEPVDDPIVSVGTGYSESKWVAERILESSRPRANPLIARLGQLTGGIGGSWEVHEWLPVLVRTSVTIGKLPELKGVSLIRMNPV